MMTIRISRWAMTVAVLILAGAVALPAWGQDATQQLVDDLRQQIQSSATMDDKTKAFAEEALLPMITDGTLVSAVEEQNAAGTSLDEIKRIDAEWSEAEEPLDVMMEKMGNPCAERLTALSRDYPAIVEAFAMDNQGAVVGENNLTSDYWQGDEAKWQDSYNGGQGGLAVGEVEFDRSANASLQQISLPIIADGGRVVGAITFGVAVSNL